MNIEELVLALNESANKYFPNGYVKIEKRRYVLGIDSYYISVSVGLISDINDVTSRIRQNDPLGILLSAEINKDDSLTVESLRSSYSINPVEKYFAMSHVKIPFRKFSGDVDKVAKNLDKYFKKARDVVAENADDTYNRANIKDIYFELGQ